MKTLWQDIKYGARMLWKERGFTLVSVLAIALGIGVNATIFGGVNAFILRTLPVDKPEEVVSVFFGQARAERVFNEFSYPDYKDVSEQSTSFTGVLAHNLTRVALGSSEQKGNVAGSRNEVIWGESVSGNYFDVLALKLAQGRGFLPEEDRTIGTHPVVVLGHSLWQRRFNADASLVGKTIALNGRDYTVVGIAPQNFTGTQFAITADFWVPLLMNIDIDAGTDWIKTRDNYRLDLLGRLKPGVSMEQAEAEMSAIAKRLSETYPKTNEATKISVVSEVEGRFDEDFGSVKLGAGLALAMVALILLVACANVANLLLARAAARRKEIAIRLALGASRARLIRQLLTESLLLALLGGGLGLLLAFWGADLLASFIPQFPFTIAIDFNPDTRIMLWTLGVTLATGLLFGLAPALQASRPELVPVLKGDASANEGGSKRRFNLRNLLVVAQIAISLVVLVCAGLFVKSFRNAQAIHPGMETTNRFVMGLDPGLLGYDEAGGKRFFTELIRGVESVPGVRGASVAYLLPMSGSTSSTGPITAEGQAPALPGEGFSALYNVVSPKHFETMGTPLVAGRDFNERDRDDAPPVIIINETMARRVFSEGGASADAANNSNAASLESVVGKRLRLGEPDTPYLEIIGVAKDARYQTLGESSRPYMYLPQLQSYYRSQANLVVETTGGDMKPVIEAVRGEVQRVDSRLPVFNVKTMDEHMAFGLWSARMAATLAVIFGALALTIAGVGLYGVMTYVVSRRTREIGIRIALGARPKDVLRLVTKQGMALALVGLGLGLAGAFAATRVLASLLYGVNASDPFVFAGIAALLAAVALIASYLPARRATKVDPMIALRYE
ncbi:MAG: ABC transporter permease [Acidobacteria bacterium]|nr:ABC transporter permease [Acidobacteriota bacterium]